MKVSNSSENTRRSVCGKLKSAAVHIATVLFWLAVWHFAASAANKDLLLKIPLPLDTFAAFINKLPDPAFLTSVGTSVLRIVCGFCSAVICGVLCGMLSYHFRLFCLLSRPILHIIRSVPVAALTIVAWLWIPSSILPGFLSALMVLPIIWSHIDAGLTSADQKYSEMARVFGMSRGKILVKIKLPLILPHLRAGCITGLGIAWKSGVAAEIISTTSNSLGALLRDAKVAIDYEDVFAVTLAVVLLSLLLENILRLLWKER